MLHSLVDSALFMFYNRAGTKGIFFFGNLDYFTYLWKPTSKQHTMKKKKNFLFYTLPWLCLLLSCLQDEESTQEHQQQIEDWFYYTDNHVAPIAKTMRRIEEEQPFMDAFSRQYGIPLWDYADIYQASNDDAVYYWIPLYNSNYPDEIRFIWYFEMKDGLLDYGPITRDATLIKEYGQDFQFDYLSYRVFGRKNASGLEFCDHAETRGYYELIGIECRDAYIIVGDITEYKGTFCKEIKVWRDTWDSDIVDEGDDEGNISGGSGSGVPVEGGGNNTPKAKKIFENQNMNERNWKTIENMLDKIDNNCMGNALHAALEDALGGNKLHIEFISGSSCGFSAYEQTISIGMDYVQSNALLHEMFHALQYYTKGKDNFNKSILNSEIEAHYAQYLYLKSLPEFKGSYWEDMYKYDPRMESIADLEEYLDQSVTATDYQELNKRLETVVDAFRKSDGYSDTLIYKYDPNQGGINTFSLLQKLIKNCN